MRSHPISQGALCPLGFGSHQLIWHPMRLRTVRHGKRASSWDEVRLAFTKACAEGPLAIVDGYPGRAASSVFEEFVAKRGGAYRVAFRPELQSLKSYESWSGIPAEALGYDLENAGTIVSFGAPMLDGWGTPGRFTRLWAERTAGKPDPQLRLIQIEPSLSRTAARAGQWIAIRPGSEAAVAAGIARVLLEEKLVPSSRLMPPMTLAESAQQSGIGVDAIRELARAIAAHPPAVAVTNGDNPSIAALNVVLGAVGTRGGIVQRSKPGKASIPADDLPSVRAVLIDSSVPWQFVPRTDAEIFRFAAWDGGSITSDWLMPAPALFEDFTDIPVAPASSQPTYAVAPALVKAPPEVQSAAEFLSSVDPSVVPVEKIIHARCENLFRGRAGTLCGRQRTPLAQVASVEKFEEQLRNGAVWIGEPQPARALRCELKEWPASAVLTTASTSPGGWQLPVLPPLATKLYQESTLLETPERRNA
jgi:hypothetical protein